MKERVMSLENVTELKIRHAKKQIVIVAFNMFLGVYD